MRDTYRKFCRSSWRRSICFGIILLAAWLIFGRVLSWKFFDNKFFDAFRVLDSRPDALVYASVLFVIEIPVFILLLQKMSDLGFIRRLVVPGIIKFREVLVGYILLSFFLLISGKEAYSYYYLPVIGITFLSLYSIFFAIRVLFDPRKLKDDENKFVSNIVNQVFDDVLKRRENGNDFFEALKKTQYVTHVFLSLGSQQQGTTPLTIRSDRSGLIYAIDTLRLETLMRQQFDEAVGESTVSSGNDQSTANANDTSPKLVLEVRPGAIVKSQATLMTLTLPPEVPTPDRKFLNKLQDAIDIDTAISDSADIKLDQLIVDFKQQIRLATDKDSVVLIQQSLEFYSLLLSGLSNFSNAVTDKGYTFADAKQEPFQMFGDSVTQQIKSIASVLNDEFLHSIQHERRDTTGEITKFLYGEMLQLVRNFDVARAALIDNSFTVTATRLVFDDPAYTKSILFREDVFRSLLFRLKEHTGILLYDYINAESDDSKYRDQLQAWIDARINDARALLIGTYKKSQLSMFNKVLEVFKEFEKEHRLYGDSIKDTVFQSRCNLFVVAAYINGSEGPSEDQEAAKQSIDNLFSQFSPQELTTILISCIDNDYSDKWRIDVYDLVADGQVYSVPDFGIKLKDLWVKYMLKLGNFPTDVSTYKSNDRAMPGTTLTFSEGLPEEHEPYLVQQIQELIAQKTPLASELGKLVENLIKERKDWEEEKLVKAPLDSEKVNKFRDDILGGYKKKAIALSIFDKVDKLEYVDNPTKMYRTLGWNQINDKEAFIEDWHAGYMMPGNEYGAEIAMAQNQSVAGKLLSKSITFSDMDNWLTNMRGKDKWVVFAVQTSPWILRGSTYEKYLKQGTPYNDIRFKKIDHLPIEYIYSDSLANGLYAVKADQVGTLKMKQTDGESIEVLVDAYSDNQQLLDAMLETPPKWLQKEGDRTSQEKFLKQKVRMYIFNTFKYLPDKTKEVLYLPINEQGA